mmetsp:Transcript_13841/g.20446  ORF Transcript_13841/g.20446 Transcript_13841/m.20446 type:complete len:188 (-) Transcript_13841:110-673(-)
MGDRASDTKITGATGRIAPDGCRFINTRVVGITDLDKFREEMSEKVADPYSVVLKRKKLPMGLLSRMLHHSLPMAALHHLGADLLALEPFEHAFGSKSRGRRIKLNQLLISCTDQYASKQSETLIYTLMVFEQAEINHCNQTVPHFKLCLDDVAEHTFPKKAGQAQKRYMRRNLRLVKGMTVKEWVA